MASDAGTFVSAPSQMCPEAAGLWIRVLPEIIATNFMDHHHHAPSPSEAQDPVCGMNVNPETTDHKILHSGKEYFFCSAGCLAKFQANPEAILSSSPKPMGSGLVSLAGPSLVKPRAIPIAESTRESEKVSRAYVCPMCPEVRQFGPGPCPKCGMALDPESPALPTTKR